MVTFMQACAEVKTEQTRGLAGGPNIDPLLTVVIPFKSSSPDRALKLIKRWARLVCEHLEVIICDGSLADPVSQSWFEREDAIRHIPVDRTAYSFANDKVNGLCTGVRAASAARVLICDDDCLPEQRQIRTLIHSGSLETIFTIRTYAAPFTVLETIEVVRSLISEGVKLNGESSPIWLGGRAVLLMALESMAGDCLFDDRTLEIYLRRRAIQVVRHPTVIIRRSPSAPTKWAEQQVRYAYEDLALLVKTTFFLILSFTAGVLSADACWHLLVALVLLIAFTSSAAAACGRCRAGLSLYYPPWIIFLAPVWVFIRACAVIVALIFLLVGGLPYGGRRVQCPAQVQFWGW